MPMRVKEKVMSTKKTLSAKLRTEDFGSAGSRRLVRAGSIPAVVYGKGEPVHVIVNAREFAAKRSGFGESTLIDLVVEGDTTHQVFVKTFQEDFLKNVVRHIDFYEVTAGHTLRTHVRVELVGTAAGQIAGGVLAQMIHELEIECLPADLPESIKVDVTKLGINETLRLEDIQVPAGIKVHGEPDAAVASVRLVKEEPEEAPAEEAAPADAAETK